MFDSTNGKYYARSDILCSASENYILLMTMPLASLLIRPIRSIRRRDTFIHDVASSFHPRIASYYTHGDRLRFRRNKHVQHAVKISTQDKRRETCMYSYVYQQRRLLSYWSIQSRISLVNSLKSCEFNRIERRRLSALSHIGGWFSSFKFLFCLCDNDTF